jgi:ribosomal protein S18 acetylase RimI-like enzyme
LQDGISRNEVFGYEDEGDLVGWLWLDLTMPEIGAHIRHLQVAQRCWGKGTGRQMVLDVIEIAQNLHCPLVTLNVTKANERAMHLYQSLGFEVEQDSGARQRMVLVFAPTD